MGDASRPTRALSISPAALSLALLAALVCPFGTGIVAGAQHADAQFVAPRLWGVTASAPRLASRARRELDRAQYTVFGRSAARVVKQLAAAPTIPAEAAGRSLKTPEHRRGHLRIASLHHGESIDVVPWDAHGTRDETAFAAVSRLFRCRVTGHEIDVDERLVKLLTALSDLYDRPVHLISGHRTPHTIETSPTSQHTRGTAADVRVPGVSIDELRAVALALGARGVGLYTENRFVHIDFRQSSKYQWSDVTHSPEDRATPERADHEVSLASITRWSNSSP